MWRVVQIQCAKCPNIPYKQKRFQQTPETVNAGITHSMKKLFSLHNASCSFQIIAHHMLEPHKYEQLLEAKKTAVDGERTGRGSDGEVAVF